MMCNLDIMISLKQSTGIFHDFGVAKENKYNLIIQAGIQIEVLNGMTKMLDPSVLI